MKNKYPKGAEWRKWDLHLHTPASYDYKNKGISNTEIIDVLSKNRISVVAITDHHEIDLVRIKELQRLGEPKGITVLPGIEFLSDSRGSEPVHFIGIFSENCNLEFIWGQLQNKTDISKMVSESKNANEVYCNLLKTIDLVHELDGIVSIHSGKKHGSVETITNSLQHTIAQKTDIAQRVDIYELGKTDDQKGYRTVVFPSIGKILPMIICSDNHNIKNYQLKDNCWLKADPTFEGLKQVIIEPEERVFIGDKPPLLDRILNNRTKYIKELSISQVDNYDNRNGVWFNNVQIPLNSELVAIIGNKGSGKSAIADILALCSNYTPNTDFSFLHPKKFKEKKLASNFKATLVWESEKLSPANLDDTPKETELRGVKYLPQGQFERLTNETSTVEKFQQEIESVVFSHIPEAERLGATSFQELIAVQTASTEAQLDAHKRDIHEKNLEIINLERKATSTYRAEVESRIKKKKEELSALIEPPPILDPNEDPDKKKLNETVNAKIVVLKTDIQKLSDALTEAHTNKKTALESLQTLKTVREDVQQKINDVARFISDKQLQLEPFDLDVTKLISVQTDFTELDSLIQSNDRELKKFKQQLGEEESTNESKSLEVQLNEKETKLKAEQEKLDGEQQQYQKYLTDKENWQKNRARITGVPDRPDTLKYYEHELVYLEGQLNADLDAKYKERRVFTCQIFDIKRQIIDVYKEARDKLKILIEKHQKTLTNYRIDIDASLVKKAGFHSKFLGAINQAKKGTFRSADEGERQFLSLVSDIDFDEQESVLSLLDSLVDALRFDKRRGEDNSQRDVADQVKDIPSLYDYLFSLEFLENNYQLKQGDKGLEQLSPGERGALLLVFYLLLDDSDIPLIIDQPEDNLDNQSVATVLVPFIREAKKRRQIIMVTHNPNLAVVSDAEQVIYVDLDKESEYTFSTISGSIEDKEVNQKIVDVLEGAMPAFNIRKRKYYDQ